LGALLAEVLGMGCWLYACGCNWGAAAGCDWGAGAAAGGEAGPGAVLRREAARAGSIVDGWWVDGMVDW
jgi:hypothetical protein